MRWLLYLFFFSTFSCFSQSDVTTFATGIYVYRGVGLTINKQPDLVIVDSGGVHIQDRDSCFQIHSALGDHHSLTIGYLHKKDTIHPQRYDITFMSMPDPKINWDAFDEYYYTGLEDHRWNTIALHRDSLDPIRHFTVGLREKHLSNVSFEVIKGTVYCAGWKGVPPTFGKTNILPDSFIDSLHTMGDTVQISITCTVQGVDGIARQIGGSIVLLKLDGERYAYHRDPDYMFNNYADTIALTKEQLFSEEELTLHNPGRLYVRMPALEKDYYFQWDNGIRYNYSFDLPYIKVPAGDTNLIEDLWSARGKYTLKMRYNETSKPIDLSGVYTDEHFLKKEVYITYPEP